MIGLTNKLIRVNKIKVRNINSVEFEKTSHYSGLKKVVFSASDVSSDLTQIAYGLLKTGELVEEHMHPTMEEFFFILKGEINLLIDDKSFIMEAGDILIIPPQTLHSMKGVKECDFLYWGVKL